MITEQTDPVAWYLLVTELEDVEEGLKNLARDMSESKDFDEIDFEIHMRHIYGHLNRAWNKRNATDAHVQNAYDNRYDELSQFPTDIEPL